MYAEQALRSCARCRAAFAVQYEFDPNGAPERRRSREGVCAVECPCCRYVNRLVLPRQVRHLVVKRILAA